MTDVIVNLLDMMRVRSTAYIAKNLTAPWGVHIDAYPNLARFHYVVSGSTWIGMRGTADAQKLERGDIAIVPHGTPHTYQDEATRPAKLMRNYPTDGQPPRFELLDRDSTDTHLLCGYFEISNHTPANIITRLPDLLINRRRQNGGSKASDLIIDLATEELANPSSGSQIRLNRLTEMLCVQAIHDWFETTLAENDYLQALADPKTKVVLDAIHDEPTRNWCVKSLAEVYGQSRSAFTSQFKKATGQSPMNYLRTWRIKLASRMLTESEIPIDEIAFKSGYADTNAFNRAFKRTIGMSPGAYRRDQRH